MKTFIIGFTFLITGMVAQAVVFTTDFAGSFTTGSLTGTEVTGSITINDFGYDSGDAVYAEIPFLPTPPDAWLTELTITIGLPFDSPITFDLSDDTSAVASFADQTLVGLTFNATSGLDTLNFVYDAYLPEGSAVIFELESLIDTSTAELDLPANVVPEPATYAFILGALALGIAAFRKKMARAC